MPLWNMISLGAWRMGLDALRKFFRRRRRRLCRHPCLLLLRRVLAEVVTCSHFHEQIHVGDTYCEECFPNMIVAEGRTPVV